MLTITLAVICACEPVEGDGWGHYFAARQPLSWDHFVAVAKSSYLHGNPRWGQLVLVAMFHAPVLAAMVSALVLVGVLVLSMALVRGRWPVTTDPADGWLFIQVLATAIATTPQFGAVWFYRPNCANYVYPLVVQLAWLLPYRFLAARAPTAGRHRWLALAMIPLGLLAGAGNEHTGIGLAVAALACTYIAWCRDRALPAWTISGVVALVAGHVALLAAPGQHERYAGLANEHDALGRIAARGVTGNLGVLLLLLAWTGPMIAVVLTIAGRRLRPLISGRTIAGFVAVAAVMVATCLAAPRVPSRMLVAPATMVALALGVFMLELATHRAKARALRAVSLVVSGTALAVTLAIFIVTGIEGRARLHQLETSPRGSVVCVAPYTFAAPTPFSWGDDFRSPHVVARVTRAFGVARIIYPCRPVAQGAVGAGLRPASEPVVTERQGQVRDGTDVVAGEVPARVERDVEPARLARRRLRERVVTDARLGERTARVVEHAVARTRTDEHAHR